MHWLTFGLALLLGLPTAMAAPRRAVPASGPDAAGFDRGGFNSAGFNTPSANRPGFNDAYFNGGGRGSSVPPIGSSGCGRMLVPAASLNQISRGFGDGHAGMDLVAAHGSPVRAAAAGRIGFMGNDPDYGLFIDISHFGGLMTRYGHLSAFASGLTIGSAVRAGTPIGRVGATGNARGAHLHFEVRASGRAIDPKPFLVGASCPTIVPREEILEARASDGRAINSQARR